MKSCVEYINDSMWTIEIELFKPPVLGRGWKRRYFQPDGIIMIKVQMDTVRSGKTQFTAPVN